MLGIPGLDEHALPYMDHREMSFAERRDECEERRFTFGWSTQSNGTFKKKKAFRCKQYKPGPNGERPCRRCKEIHEWEQEKRITEPISEAFTKNAVLYLARIENSDESKKLIYRLKRKKISYLSIPCNEDGGRIFLMDRYDRMASPVVADEESAKDAFVSFKDKSEWGYFSGNLGKSTDESDDIISFEIPDDLNVDVDPLLMNNVQVEATFEIGAKAQLTIENARDMVIEKFNIVLRILKECGYRNAIYRGTKFVDISFSKLQESWYAADVGIVTENELDMYPRPMSWEMQNVAERGMRELKEKNRNFLREQKDANKK